MAAVAYSHLTLFGIVWMVVAAKLHRQAHPTPPELVFWLLFGLGLLFATAPLQAWILARRTLYVLTDRRAVILEPRLLGGSAVMSFCVTDWKNLDIYRRRDGSGNITFANFGMGGRLGFKYLPDLSVVEPLVRALARRDVTVPM
jgi:hypothetical protein